MTKANLKNILTAVRDIINRSRIAYKDYLGEETVTETKVLVEGTLSEQGTLTRKDPSFTRFVAGEEYKVTIDGTTQTLTAISNNGIEGITNVINFENPGENYFAVSVNPKKGQPICSAGGTYVGKTISISQTKTTTTKKYDIKKVPQELIPDTIARSVDVAKVETKAYNAFNKANAAQSTANAAQTAANAAQTAAENAQTAATNAQNTANTAKTTAENLSDEVTKVSGGTFYNPNQRSSTDSVALLAGNSNAVYDERISGIDFYVSDPSHFDVYAETLIYTQPPKAESELATVCFKGWSRFHTSFILGVELADISAITLNSSTPDSTKKFKITVDDTGTLSATEVTA